MEPNPDIARLVSEFLSKSFNSTKIQEMINSKKTRLILSIDKLREFNEDLTKLLITSPLKIIKIFENDVNNLAEEALTSTRDEKLRSKTLKINTQNNYRVGFEGTFGKNMISPRGLTANLANQLVCIQGIVTRVSIVRPKLTSSVHYCEETKQGQIKDYNDQYSINQPNELGGQGQSINFMSNSVPLKDSHGHILSFEYGLSNFKDFQTILIQEPPERTPVGQLPRSIEVVVEEDLIDKAKPGDRIQLTGVFKCIVSTSSSTLGTFKTVIIAVDVQPINTEIEAPKLTGEDIRKIKEVSNRSDCFEVLSNSIAPSIFGHEFIKKALVLQLLGGVEKNLENGTHLRGDINVLLIGDPSTAKSQVRLHFFILF